MKRDFTKLMAAFALLVFMMPSMAGWGQTRETMDYTQLYSADFTTVANHSYTQNHAFTLNEKSWTSSVSQVAGGVFYLGCNSNNAEKGILGNNSTFSDINAALIATGDHYTSGTNHAYALRFDNAYNNVTKVTFNWAGGNNAFQVYLFGDSGSGYVMLGHTNYATSGQNVSGSVEWTGDATNYTKFAIVARPGTSSSNATNKTLRAASFYVYETSGGSQTTYTVTLADDNTTLTQSAPDASVTLPTRSAIGSYTFAGWSETNVEDETTTAPTIITAGPYTPTSDITLYPVYTRTEDGGSTIEWHLTNLSDADAGVYALLTTDYHAFNGTISSGHGQATTDVFSFTDGVATTAPTGVCEITFESVSGGFKMHNDSKGYLYASAASSGKLAWHDSESSYWFYGSSNWKYNANNAFLRSYNNSSFRTYGQNNGEVLKLAKKIEVSGVETYYWSSPGSIPTITANNVDITYNATNGSIAYEINNPPTPVGTMTAAVVSGGTIANLAIGTIANNSVAFTCAANNTNTVRTATVTLTYTYGDNETVTKNVTITQAADPNALDIISDIVGANELRNVKGTIVAMSSRGFILGDGTGYVYYYGGSNFTTTHDIGDVVKLSGTTSSYNHVIQFPAETTITDATNSGYNNTPAVQILDATGIGAYSSGLHLSDYVQFQGTLSITTSGTSTFYNVAVSNLSNAASISYPTAAQITELEALDDQTVIVKGYFAGVSSGHFNVILESIEELVVPVINASNVTLAYNATSGEIGYTITNPVTGTALAATTSADWISGITVGAESVTFTTTVNNTTEDRTATVTLTYGSVTKTVTVTQEHFVADYATLPFAFDGGRADVATTVGLTQSGLGTDYTPSAANDYSPRLKFDSTDDWLILKFIERPGELSYDIMGNSFNGSTFKVQTSVDGVTYTDFATYTNLDNTKRHITHNNLAEDVRYIKWVYTEKVSGNVALGNIELDVYQAPQEYDLTIGTPPNITIIARYGNNQSVVNGNTAAVLSSTVVTLLLTPSSGYVLDQVTVYDAQDNPISLTEVSDNVYSFVMPSIDVTVSADVIAAHQEYYYTRATSLEPGRRYIIVAERNGKYLAMGAQKNNNRNAKPISVDGTTATVIRSDVHEFTIGSIDDNSGHYFIFDVDGEGESSGYLYAGSSSSNWLKTETELDEYGHWTITVNPETGEGTIIGQSSYTRNVMRFNQDNELFSCYAAGNSDNQYPVYLYMKDDGFDLTINGYTDVTTGTNNKGYYLIASPVTVNPADVAGMTEGTFDLYYYDDSQTLEWINWKGDQNPTLDHGGFDLVPGTGYLYAKKATTPGETYTFTLSGEVYSGDGEIPLVDGWNLIGNPYNSQVSPITDYYEMNGEGSEIIAGESWVIEPMQGIFINNEYGETSTSFSILSKGARKAGLSLNVSRDNNLVDRAIVRFGEGRQLPKFQLFDNSTKLYIPQGDRDYAVVYAESAMGELPVRFKAERNGTYTLSMNAMGLNLDYLHLIDNMTGADVDLLVTPSYTFEACTKDYESRFKLVFSQQAPEPVEGPSNFAFFNGSAWAISNEGPATLQVVDVTGRIVSTQSISGNATVSINESAGIYTLRLVNGDDVKVQKVVVR